MECMCAHISYSHLKGCLGNGVRTHVNSKKKIPSTRGSEEGGTPDTASCRTGRPTHYQPSYSGPLSQTNGVMKERLFLFVGCLTSQQHVSVSQGRICSDNCTYCHIEIEDQTFHLTQSQYTDTTPISPSTDPITPGAWQGSHWSANF